MRHLRTSYLILQGPAWLQCIPACNWGGPCVACDWLLPGLFSICHVVMYSTSGSYPCSFLAHRLRGSRSTHLRAVGFFWRFIDARKYFPLFFTWRKIDVESNTSGFIFFRAFINYLWIFKEFCGRHLFLIMGLAKPNRPLLNLSPKCPKEPKLTSHTFKSNSKCYNFCIRCPNSIKTCWKICTLSSSSCHKIFTWIWVLLILWKPIEVHEFNWVHQTAFEGFNFGGLYLLRPMFVLNKIWWVMFPF